MSLFTSPALANSSAPLSQDAAIAKRFEGRVAFVTGASDKGIGGAIAERFAREGGSLAILSRHKPERLIKRLQKLETPLLAMEGDVTKPADLQRAFERSADEFGKIDIVVNNAGVERASRFDRFTEEEWRELLDVNLNGAINTIRAALPVMQDQGGVIVNIASALALGGCSGFSIYSASKAALIGLTQSLAWELSPRGIRVVAVAPGLVHTPMIHKHIGQLNADVVKQIEASHPLGMGSPHDVAAAVAFLASADARWITGVTLPLGWAQHYPLPTGAFMS